MTRVVHLASEARPWASSGGLAEVAASLSQAQFDAGDDAWLVLPAYRDALRWAAKRGVALRDTGVHGEVHLPVGRWPWRALRADTPGRPVVLVDCPALFDRDGLYHGADHVAFDDNALRFAVFVRAALAAMPALLAGPADVLHSHDWQTALAPYYLDAEHLQPQGGATATERAQLTPRAWAGCASVFTIHNLGYPGRFPAHVADQLGLGHFHPGGLEFYGDLALIKAGIVWADAVTTVSPTYAREIRTPAHGEGFDGLLRHVSDRLYGVLNGVDPAWSPAADPHIAAAYSAADLSGKAACRAALLAEFGLSADASTPVFGCVSRFAHQKGLDLVADVTPDLVAHGAKLVVLGSGDPALEDRFRALQATYPGHVGVVVGYDVGLSHRVEAGVDAFLMPSRYEPCGLNQLYSMAYGTPPVVHRTGGLADTVTHASAAALAKGTATGFVFDHADAAGLRWAVGEAVSLFRADPGAWRQLQLTGMGRDSTWRAAQARYAEIYVEALARRRARR